jgi:hypothetical protein
MNHRSAIIAREVPGFSTVARQTIIRTVAPAAPLQFAVTHWRAPELIQVDAAGEEGPYACKLFPTRREAMNWIESQLAA